MNKTIPTDALVTTKDVLQIKGEIARGDLHRLVCELITREPELAIAVSEKFDLVLTMLEGAALSVKHRALLSTQLSLLTWMPLLLLDRAHRRAWNDFLPAEDDAETEGGGV